MQSSFNLAIMENQNSSTQGRLPSISSSLNKMEMEHSPDQSHFYTHLREPNPSQIQFPHQVQMSLQQAQNKDQEVQNSERRFLDKFKKSETVQNFEPLKAQNLSNSSRFLTTVREENANLIASAFKSLSLGSQSNNLTSLQQGRNQHNQQDQQKELVEEVHKAITEGRINPVSLLNEVASKVKKSNPDFKVEQSLSNAKILMFECWLEYDVKNIGYGKGNSKQAAKIDASKQVLNVLLNDNQYETERIHIMLYMKANQHVSTTQRNIDENGMNSHTFSGSDNPDGSGNTALYDMNLIAKECFIQVKWDISSPDTAHGGFKAGVNFDGLIAYGEGRKKIDAQREAAQKILELIRNNMELSRKYDLKANKKAITYLKSGAIVKGQMTSLYQVKETPKQSIEAISKNFNHYLSRIDEKYMVSTDTQTVLEDFLMQIRDFTKTIYLVQQQSVINSQMDPTLCFEKCSLEPIGSFALGCMRNDNLSIDALLILNKKFDISEQDILISYHNCLIKANERSQMRYKIQVEAVIKDIGACLIITTSSSVGQLSLTVQVAREPQMITEIDDIVCRRYNCSFLHVNRIKKSIEKSESGQEFRKLMKLMRIWRRNNDLNKLPSELLDAILASGFTSQKKEPIEVYIIKCLTVSGTQDAALSELRKCGQIYEKIYEKMPDQAKQMMATQCNRSLEVIFNGDFSESCFS